MITFSRNIWFDADDNEITYKNILLHVTKYINDGEKVYIGVDSMLYNSTCVFAIVIAFHNRDKKIAKYFFKRIKKKSHKFKDLQCKIMEEVNLALQTAQLITRTFPTAEVELHIDIGTEKENATSKYFNFIKGWVTGTGYSLKVKPYSWASSSVADWHTK